MNPRHRDDRFFRLLAIAAAGSDASEDAIGDLFKEYEFDYRNSEIPPPEPPSEDTHDSASY